MRSRKSEFFDEWTDQEVSDMKDALHKAISELGPRSFLRSRLVRYVRWFDIEDTKRTRAKVVGSIKPTNRSSGRKKNLRGQRRNIKMTRSSRAREAR